MKSVLGFLRFPFAARLAHGPRSLRIFSGRSGVVGLWFLGSMSSGFWGAQLAAGFVEPDDFGTTETLDGVFF